MITHPDEPDRQPVFCDCIAAAHSPMRPPKIDRCPARLNRPSPPDVINFQVSRRTIVKPSQRRIEVVSTQKDRVAMGDRQITGKTKLLGVMGDPITHSLSPVLQNAAIAHFGLDYVYLPFAVTPDQLGPALSGLQAIGCQGFNVTIPHKQTIIPWLAEVSPVAIAVGAVNTVWPVASGWAGTNTDVLGFLAPLLALDLAWSQLSVVVLGYGGAARAVVAGCAQQGCAAIHVIGRSPDKLDQFAASWSAAPWPLPLQIHPWGAMDHLLPQAQLIVNTTPIGMSPRVDATPVSAEQLAQLPAGAIAYDVIYTPQPTQFLRSAAAIGAICLDGTEMLIHQGAAAFEQWLHKPAPIALMRHALQQQLDQAD